MRIAFLVGKFEARDGVSDYVGALVSALACRGHHVTLLVLCQPHGSTVPQPEDIPEEHVLALSSAMPWSRRAALAADFLDRHAVEDLSLHFLCHFFGGRRGLVYQLAWYLPRLRRGRRLNIMFHELWTPFYTRRSTAEVIKGGIRWVFLRWLVHRSQPDSVFTSTPAFASKLSQVGCCAVGTVPVFANIAKSPPHAGFLRDFLAKHHQMEPGPRENFSVGVIFGSLQPAWDGTKLIEELSRECAATGRKLLFLLLGRQYFGMPVWERLKAQWAREASFVHLGEAESNEISWILSECDFGIATTSAALWGKSSTVAAMRLHGLPIFWDESRGPQPQPRDFRFLGEVTAVGLSRAAVTSPAQVQSLNRVAMEYEALTKTSPSEEKTLPTPV